MTDSLQDLKLALEDLRARYPIGEEPPPLVAARLLELARLIAWSKKHERPTSYETSLGK